MAKKAGLQLIISLVDEASSGLQKITGSMKGLAMVGGAAVVAGMAAVGKAAWDAGMIYDDAMDTIITKTGASGDALAGLEKDFKAVFSTIPTEAGPASDVIAALNSKLGITGPVLQDTTKSLLEMSRILGGDATSNAAQFSEIMGKWSIPVEQGSLALDKLFVASQKTGVGVDTLMQQVLRFGAPLQQFGFSFDEATAIVAEFERTGVNTEQAMGGLTKALGAFAKAGKDPEQALNDLVKQIRSAGSESEATKLAVENFGAKAGPELAAAIREGRLSVDDLTAAMGGAEGAIMRTADATADFPEKFQVLKNKVTTLLMPLGSIMVSGLTAAVDAIGPAVDGAIAWIQKVGGEGTTLGTMWTALQTLAQTVFPKVRDVVVGSMLAVGGMINDYVVPALTTFVNWLATNLPPAIQAAADFFNNTLLPAFRVVAAFVWETVIPAIVEVITWLATNLPPAIQAASDFWNNTLLPALQAVAGFIGENVIPVIEEIINWLATNLPPAIQAASNFFNTVLLPAITAIANFITEKVIPAIVAINDWLGTKIGPVIEIARMAFEGVLLPVLTLIWDIIVQKLIPIIEKLNTWLGQTIIAAIGRAKQALDELKQKFDPVLNVIKDIVDWIGNRLQPAIDGFKEFIGSIHFGNPFGGLLNTIGDIIGKIEDAINKLRELLGLTGGKGGGGDGKAAGTFFAPGGLTLVGERGPELVALPRASRVYSAGETQQMMGGGSTFYFQFAAPATAYDERRVEAAVERAMLRAGVRADMRQRTR